jgi:hypothetical protein
MRRASSFAVAANHSWRPHTSTVAATTQHATFLQSFFSHRVSRRDLRPGDHLYLWSSFLHHHHGIYVGAGRDVGGVPSVIHVYGQNKGQSRIQLDSLSKFAAGRRIRRCRYDTPWWEQYVKAPGTVFPFHADARELVVQRAWKWLAADRKAVAASAARAERSTGEGAAEDEAADAEMAEQMRILRSAIRRGAVTGEPASKQLMMIEDTPFVYNLLRRNCECFCLLCTAPERQSGSHQAQQLTRFNPIATLIVGLYARWDHYAHKERKPNSILRWLWQPAEIRTRLDALRKYAKRVRSRTAAAPRLVRMRLRAARVQRRKFSGGGLAGGAPKGRARPAPSAPCTKPKSLTSGAHGKPATAAVDREALQ